MDLENIDGSCLTQGDWKHVVGMHQAKIARLEQELRDARYAIGMLVHAAGGRVILKVIDMVTFESRNELTLWDDPISGARILELRKSVSAGEKHGS